MGHYVGMDVGLRSSSLCIVDEQGKVCLEREVDSEIDEIAAAIQGFADHVDGVALETGNLTPWLTAGLRAEGFRVVVMEARQVKTTLSSLRNKTDRKDARGIAQILRTGWYREVHVKSLESQRLKTLLAARKALRRRIDLENEVRGLLKVYGFKLFSHDHVYVEVYHQLEAQHLLATCHVEVSGSIRHKPVVTARPDRAIVAGIHPASNSQANPTNVRELGLA